MKKAVIAALASVVIALGGCSSGNASSSSASSDPSSGSTSAFSSMSDTVDSTSSSSNATSSSASSSSASSSSASSSSSDSSLVSDMAEEIEKAESEQSASASGESESAQGESSAEASGQAAPAQPSNSVLLSDFVVLSQYPELPNGCEVTTLTAVLNYQGVAADKTVLSDDFLPKAPVGQANFYREFVGNPRDDDAYGCYAPVIVATAQSYIAASGTGLSVTDLTGSSLESLFPYVAQGTPVIVWATQYNQQGHYSVTWTVDGQDYTWFTPEHCIALVGYDLDQGTVTVADPMTGGLETYDRASFESNYNDLHQQAIVIQ